MRLEGGRRRHLDVYWDDWRVAAEIDGSAHTDVRHWWDDSLRQNELVVSGDVVLRFPAHIVRSAPALVANQIRRALLARAAVVS